jgi:hypothetical protein
VLRKALPSGILQLGHFESHSYERASQVAQRLSEHLFTSNSSEVFPLLGEIRVRTRRSSNDTDEMMTIKVFDGMERFRNSASYFAVLYGLQWSCCTDLMNKTLAYAKPSVFEHFYK